MKIRTKKIILPCLSFTYIFGWGGLRGKERKEGGKRLFGYRKNE